MKVLCGASFEDAAKVAIKLNLSENDWAWCPEWWQGCRTCGVAND